VKVFLTGGTGLLGSHLAEELLRSGAEVVALHRPGADTLFLEESGCALAPGDVLDSAELLAPLMAGCTHVVHGAALVYAGGTWPAIRAVNVEGTRHVLEAAALAGLTHAVHVSSVAVYGTVDDPVSEGHAIDADVPEDDLYARSKRMAETEARLVERERGLPVTVVRPSAVYGERDRLMIPVLAEILRKPVVPIRCPWSTQGTWRSPSGACSKLGREGPIRPTMSVSTIHSPSESFSRGWQLG